MGMMGGYNSYIGNVQSAELNEALESIYAFQNISSLDDVDCKKVTDDQFEFLGDAYMRVMIPDEDQHEAMDNMMGGEGSESLRLAHINMGRSYLGCWSGYSGTPYTMPMMSMMSPYGMGNYANSGWNSAYFTVTFGLVWIFLILSIFALVKFLLKK
ncbi:MAG: hypothetical protein COU07_01095 [Candidatus Harrisonbacteria bacterium CG10_big_fil_rev_8_21_14_0_10_40_38]|uniref:RNase III domain-containing protein n=1 Tax=Candidatus Harrisonbacteria bacterium CG10_big_fil_rev_8_21_14_0_10_40_38 TaxID=1974583 RepID=A0A2H0UST4_9BACT|nr:MAG: hypothetical protein COU07_01095 [Candidatus Harrisonbacteria bacterium CG10_big_fil_rev_8_21_14_0_10_40_38]